MMNYAIVVPSQEDFANIPLSAGQRAYKIAVLNDDGTFTIMKDRTGEYAPGEATAYCNLFDWLKDVT
jgi:hypothetical protein